MKKFQFSLETVLSYKKQVLDAQQAEHAMILSAVRAQEQRLQSLQDAYAVYAEQYRVRCAEGMEIKDVLVYQAGLRAREREIQQEAEELERLRRQEEDKRKEVVAAKQEASSIEKLREKQLNVYHAAAAKSEEQFIEEFVSMKRCVALG